MKQPVWILNSSLLVLFFMSQLLLFMLQRAVPRRASIDVGAITIAPEKAVIAVDIAKIYEQDVFGTYDIPIDPIKSFADDVVAPMPPPPKSIMPQVPVEKAPVFFAPLEAVLKGVIFVKDDPASCIAIVQLKKTKEEHNYQVGDLIEDAQILKIFSNRIIIIRSNGQQETLYLREEDAATDFNMEVQSTPKSVIEDFSDNKYTINIDEFGKRVHNLGEFINLLDLTTVYKQGKSFGCRIGKIDSDSLGAMLGFMVDDIVVRVDSYYVDDLPNRIQLYDHIMQKGVGDTIEVVINRGHNTITLLYGLVDNVSKKIIFTPQQIHKNLTDELHKNNKTVSSSVDTNVKVQNVSAQQASEIMDAYADQDAINDDIDIFTLKANPVVDDNDEMQRALSSKRSVSSSGFIKQASEQTFNQSSMHEQRLIEERNNLMPALRSTKSREKNNMEKYSRKNVIFNGMQ